MALGLVIVVASGAFAYGDRPGKTEREFGLDLIATAPSVVYKIHRTDGRIIDVDNPASYPSIRHD